MLIMQEKTHNCAIELKWQGALLRLYRRTNATLKDAIMRAVHIFSLYYCYIISGSGGAALCQ